MSNTSTISALQRASSEMGQPLTEELLLSLVAVSARADEHYDTETLHEAERAFRQAKAEDPIGVWPRTEMARRDFLGEAKRVLVWAKEQADGVSD